MPRYYTNNVGFDADLTPGNVQHIVSTVNGAQTITLPDGCAGVKLYPRDADLRFNVGAAAAATGATGSGATIAANEFGAGGIAKSGQWEVRLILGATTLYLHSDSSQSVDIEVW